MLVLVGLVLVLLLGLLMSELGRDDDVDDVPVIGYMTQHGWVQKKGPSAVNKGSRDIHRM